MLPISGSSFISPFEALIIPIIATTSKKIAPRGKIINHPMKGMIPPMIFGKYFSSFTSASC
jgi:hypothetical protein